MFSIAVEERRLLQKRFSSFNVLQIAARSAPDVVARCVGVWPIALSGCCGNLAGCSSASEITGALLLPARS